MDIEDFYKEFDGLNSTIIDLKDIIKKEKKKIGSLERSLETKQSIQDVFEGLETTPIQQDSGKDGPAFYFVRWYSSEEIRESDIPSLYQRCPGCRKEKPVLMRYEQTFDSPDGEIWEKEIFILCRKDGASRLVQFSRDSRF